VKLAVKSPNPSVVAVVICPELPKVTLTMEDAAKPFPLTETEEPACPLTGVKETLGTTLKLLDSVVVPSVALIVFEPAVAAGTVMVVVKYPLPLDGTGVKVVESKETVIGALALKLLPVTVTTVPTPPLTGVALKVVG